ncbi:MAG: hypothetical protein ACC656_10820, partial [Candidatus Heimdallarchaeota archaeon]
VVIPIPPVSVVVSTKVVLTSVVDVTVLLVCSGRGFDCPMVLLVVSSGKEDIPMKSMSTAIIRLRYLRGIFLSPTKKKWDHQIIILPLND